MKAAVTIGYLVQQAKDDLLAAGVRDIGDWWWYVDDGQIFVHPKHVDKILKALDVRLDAAGAPRGSRAAGQKIKSTVRVYIPDGLMALTDLYHAALLGAVPPLSWKRCKNSATAKPLLAPALM